MQHIVKHFIIMIVTALIMCSAIAAIAETGCVSPEPGTSSYDLNGAVRYYEDASAKQSFQDILGTNSSWAPVRETAPSFGFSSSAYWLKFDICEAGPSAEKSVLEINYPLLDSIQLFVLSDRTITQEISTGDSIPFSLRPVKHRNFIFHLPAPSKEPLTVYLRVLTESAVQVPLRLYTEPGFFIHDQRELAVQGLYFGIILAMMLYNIFLFFSLREWPYLLYVFYTISYFSFQGVLQGFFQQFLFDSVWFQSHALLLFGFICILFANLFACSFLNLQKNNLLAWQLLRGSAWIAGLAALLASALPYIIMVKLMLCLAIVSSTLILTAGFKLWWAGHLPARIFTLAWSTLLISFVLASLNKFGLLPRIFWTENIMQIGGVCEVVLLSIALGERINEEKRQRMLAERNLSTSLEEMVRERTLALNQALEQLEKANSILDKMSLTDSLTQIANRRAFDKQLEREYRSALRGGYPLTLIMLDIDHFKQINDTYGHQTGDQVLQALAHTLRSCASRPRDNVFRYGGEEFAVLLNETSLSGARNVAEKMRTSISSSRFNSQHGTFAITISAGISEFDPNAANSPILCSDDLIRQADIQLYRSKAGGRNRVEPSKTDEIATMPSLPYLSEQLL